MKTAMTLLGHDVVITPSIDALSDNARDNIIDEIVNKIIDGAGCFNVSGIDYEWEIKEDAESMRDTVEKAFLEALEVENITIAKETREVMLETILEEMWQGFDEKVREIIHAELIQ